MRSAVLLRGHSCHLGSDPFVNQVLQHGERQSAVVDHGIVKAPQIEAFPKAMLIKPTNWVVQ